MPPKTEATIEAHTFDAQKTAFYSDIAGLLQSVFQLFLTRREEICAVCSDPCEAPAKRFAIHQLRFYELGVVVLLSFVKDGTREITLKNLKAWMKDLDLQELMTLKEEEPEPSPVVTKMIKTLKHDLRNMGYSAEETVQFFHAINLEG